MNSALPTSADCSQQRSSPSSAPQATASRGPLGCKRFLRDNGLVLALIGLFGTFWVGECLTGFHVYNDERKDHRQAPVAFSRYVTSAHFIEASAENWESEFLEMFFYVVLTSFLYQNGSAESKRPGTFELVDVDPRAIPEVERRKAPWPVSRGGWVLGIYQYSLSIALFLLFACAFVLHMIFGARAFNEQQAQHGGATVSALGYVANWQFWFQSFQNWQSEFLGIGAMVFLTIWLRQKGSPESKPVYAAHSETDA